MLTTITHEHKQHADGESSDDEERKKGRVWKFPPIFFSSFSSGEKCEWRRRKPGEMKMKMKKESFFLVIFSSLLLRSVFRLTRLFFLSSEVFFFVVFNGAPENMCTREGGRNMCESVREDMRPECENGGKFLNDAHGHRRWSSWKLFSFSESRVQFSTQEGSINKSGRVSRSDFYTFSIYISSYWLVLSIPFIINIVEQKTYKHTQQRSGEQWTLWIRGCWWFCENFSLDLNSNDSSVAATSGIYSFGLSRFLLCVHISNVVFACERLWYFLIVFFFSLVRPAPPSFVDKWRRAAT